MIQKTDFAVYSTTSEGKEYIVKPNLESLEEAEEWARNNANAYSTRVGPPYPNLYPNGLFAKKVSAQQKNNII